MSVPDHGGGVVVAVKTQRPSQAGFVLLVPLAARQPTPVRAVAGLPSWPASGDLPAGQLNTGVHGTKGRGGEGGEYARVNRDRLGHAFATGQTGADQLVGVGPVGFRARRADRGAPVPARQVDHLVGSLVRVKGMHDLTG